MSDVLYTIAVIWAAGIIAIPVCWLMMWWYRIVSMIFEFAMHAFISVFVLAPLWAIDWLGRQFNRLVPKGGI